MKKQLPAHPNLEQLKKQARSVLNGHHGAVAHLLARIRESHPRFGELTEGAIASSRFTLADAQLVIAREYGFENWSALKALVLSNQGDPSPEKNLGTAIRSLLDAAGKGDLAQVNSLIDADPALIDEVGGPGVRTALHHAVFGKSEAAVKLLLDRGADPNIRCEGDNAYPLHFAAEKQNFPIVRLLIEHGADPLGEGDYHELGVIGWATAWEPIQANTEIVQYLLAHGARHNIFSAVAMGDVAAIGNLIAASPLDMERRMDMGNRRRRPLHLAVIKKQPASLIMLLELGANMESLDEAAFTALDQAALDGNTAMAQILLDRGAKIRLPAAVALGRTRDVERLLRRDPDALMPGRRWGNLILRASERASGMVIDALIQAGASVNVHDDPKTSVDSTFGYTPLHAAAYNGNFGAAAALLKHGANVRAREDKYHGTPAGWADYAGHGAIRDLILQGDVDIMEAVQNGLIERVKMIVHENPDSLNCPFSAYAVYPRYAEGWYTPLAFAVTRGNAEMAQGLLDLGADATIRSPEGESLYSIALAGGHPNIAAMLGPEHPPQRVALGKNSGDE